MEPITIGIIVTISILSIGIMGGVIYLTNKNKQSTNGEEITCSSKFGEHSNTTKSEQYLGSVNDVKCYCEPPYLNSNGNCVLEICPQYGEYFTDHVGNNNPSVRIDKYKTTCYCREGSKVVGNTCVPKTCSDYMNASTTSNGNDSFKAPDKTICYCNSGFSFRDNRCIRRSCLNSGSSEKSLSEIPTPVSFRLNNGTNCFCRQGYKLSPEGNRCVPKTCNDYLKSSRINTGGEKIVLPDNSNCFCAKDHSLKNDICTLNTCDSYENTQSYNSDPTARFTKSGGTCYCKRHYKWNESQNKCIKKTCSEYNNTLSDLDPGNLTMSLNVADDFDRACYCANNRLKPNSTNTGCVPKTCSDLNPDYTTTQSNLHEQPCDSTSYPDNRPCYCPPDTLCNQSTKQCEFRSECSDYSAEKAIDLGAIYRPETELLYINGERVRDRFGRVCACRPFGYYGGTDWNYISCASRAIDSSTGIPYCRFNISCPGDGETLKRMHDILTYIRNNPNYRPSDFIPPPP